MAILAIASALPIYLMVILATIKLRNKPQNTSEKSFKVPGGLVIPFIGIPAIVWLLTSLNKVEILSTIIFIVIVCIIYFVMGKFKNSRLLEDIREELI